MIENGNLVFIFSVSPVITNLNSTVDTNKREAVLDCVNGSISNLCSYSLRPDTCMALLAFELKLNDE